VVLVDAGDPGLLLVAPGGLPGPDGIGEGDVETGVMDFCPGKILAMLNLLTVAVTGLALKEGLLLGGW